MLARHVSPNLYNPNATGWWEGSYTGAPWVGLNSSGGSGARNLVTAGADPGTGTAQNGYTPADLNGSSQYLVAANDATVHFSTAAGAVIGLYLLDSVAAAAPAGQPYDDAALVALGGAGEIIAAVNSTGLRCAIYDGAYQEIQLSAGGATGAYAIFMMTWNSTNLVGRVNSGGTTSIAAGAIDTLTTFVPQMGTNYNGSVFVDGRVLGLQFYNRVPSLAEYTACRQRWNKRFGLSL